MNTRKSTLRCWQCGQHLMLDKWGKVIHVTITDPIGNTVRVHKVCAQNTGKQFQQLSAQRSEGVPSDRIPE